MTDTWMGFQSNMNEEISRMADAAANYANLKLYKETGSNPVVPAMGLVGCIVALPIVVYYLLLESVSVLFTIMVIFMVLFLTEVIFVNRKKIAEGIEELEGEEGIEELEGE